MKAHNKGKKIIARVRLACDACAWCVCVVRGTFRCKPWGRQAGTRGEKQFFARACAWACGVCVCACACQRGRRETRI